MNKKGDKKSFYWIPKFFRKDSLRKVISLIFAIIVWFGVSNQLGKEAKIDNVKVDVETPPNLLVLNESKPTVTLRVSASEKMLNVLSPSDFKVNVSVDDDDYRPGKPFKIQITPKVVTAPFGVRVLAVEDSVLQLQLDLVLSKQIKIKAKFTGSPPLGYAPGKVTLEPSEATVTGPKSLIRAFESISTDPIVLDKTTIESFDFMVPLENKYQLISVSPPRTFAQIEINKEYETKLFRSVPLKVLLPTGNFNLLVTPLTTPNVDVEITGLKRVVETLKPDQIEAFVDVSPFGEPGSYYINVACSVTESKISVNKVIPKQVQISLTRKKP